MDAESRAARFQRARSQMRREGVDLLAVAPSDDLRYLLGFSPTADERPCILLLDSVGEVFVVPALNAVQSRAHLPELRFVTWEDADGATDALLAALGTLPEPRTIAVDTTMRAEFLLLLQQLTPAARFVTAAHVVGELRLRKDAGEVAALRASAKAADLAMTAALDACVPGAAEREVAEAAVATFRRAGCEVMFTSVASGQNGAYPHHHTGERQLERGEAVTIDIGARLNGYASDITRMGHVGEPDERLVKVHAAVEAAVRAALAAVRSGATCASVDRAARSAIEDAGFGDYFVHRTGHGLGLSGHEPPWLMAGEERELDPGMVVSIEPGIYIPAECGVRLEEIVVVEDDGCEVLSGLGRDLHVV